MHSIYVIYHHPYAYPLKKHTQQPSHVWFFSPKLLHSSPYYRGETPSGPSDVGSRKRARDTQRYTCWRWSSWYEQLASFSVLVIFWIFPNRGNNSISIYIYIPSIMTWWILPTKDYYYGVSFRQNQKNLQYRGWGWTSRVDLRCFQFRGWWVVKVSGSWWLRLIVFWVVVSNIFYFHPYLGKIPNLTNIFNWVETTNQFFYGLTSLDEFFSETGWWVAWTHKVCVNRGWSWKWSYFRAISFSASVWKDDHFWEARFLSNQWWMVGRDCCSEDDPSAMWLVTS